MEVFIVSNKKELFFLDLRFFLNFCKNYFVFILTVTKVKMSSRIVASSIER